jgi:hypothetical protein
MVCIKGIINNNDVPINTTWTLPNDVVKGVYESIFENDFLTLAPGQYRISIGLSQGKHVLHYIENLFLFEVVPIIESISENVINFDSSSGLILNQFKMKTKKIN